MPKTFTATQILVVLNVAAFLLVTLLLPEAWVRTLPLYYPNNQNFRVWQFLTSLFVHANFTHLLFNMFGLFSFGSLLERVWGSKRFLIFYFAAGLGAGVIYSGVNMFQVHSTASALLGQGVSQEVLDQLDTTFDPRQFASAIASQAPAAIERVGVKKIGDMFYTHHIPAVGASGAIYGILTAFGLLFPNAKLSLIFLPIPIAAKFFIPALLLMDLFSGITGFSIFGGGIAHFAHLGGALIGFVLMILWKPSTPQFQFRDAE